MKVKDIFVSAPGKAILHGEHAVVHGKVTRDVTAVYVRAKLIRYPLQEENFACLLILPQTFRFSYLLEPCHLHTRVL